METFQHVICDLDGVVWSGSNLIEGSAKAITQIQEVGSSIWFVTNNSNKPASSYLNRLSEAGVSHYDQIITSAQAAATLVNKGERVLICAGEGVKQAVRDAGAVPVANTDDSAVDQIDAVIVGLHTEFDYYRLDRAARAVRNGARLIGTNSDVTFPTADGEAPGGGSILAAVEAASGVTAVLAGKPNQAMAAAVKNSLGGVFDPQHSVMIGDRYSTDGQFAVQLGCRFIAVSSGVAPDDSSVPVWQRAASLSDAVRFVSGTR
ncbi:MAG: HAD-IIA family hydrolase [Ilumatobacteraceae bacterium]